MARGQIETPEEYKKWVLNLVDDLRAPDKGGSEIVFKDGEQRKREYEDAKAKAAETGNPDDIDNAKRLKAIVQILNDVEESRKLTDQAQALYENIDANRKKLNALKQLDEGKSDEAKKIQRQLVRARAGLQEIETKRDVYGPNPKSNQTQTPAAKVKPEAGTTAGTPAAPAGTQVKPTTPSKGTGTSGAGTPAAPAAPVTKTPSQKTEEALGVAGGADFALPETLFKHVPSLNAILQKFVNGEIASVDGLRKAIRDDVWYKQNSQEIKNRYVQLYNYQDLVATGQAQGTTAYEKEIAGLERKLADKARAAGSGLASDPAALRKAAENMYITNVGIDDPMTNDFIVAAIRPITSTIGGRVTEGYSGQALKDYQDIQAVAKANGFKISDILPGAQNEQQVLQGIAKGTIDINRLSQDARKLAAQGQPQYVRDLLGQGYNLDQILSPYRNTMASVLEIQDPNQIDLNDPTLRSAISDKGDMNIYDFKKLLKQDNRWQYTENAKQEVSDAALKVLRDFGFQG